MRPTRYHRPKSLGEANELFAGAADPRYLAGGQSLLPAMKQRLAAPSDLIDLAAIPDLRGIAEVAAGIRIGGGVTHAAVAADRLIRARLPSLASLAATIGDRAVRNRGTLGGSLAHNDPTADYPAAMLALAAIVHTDRRNIPADDFFTGLFAAALDPGEIVVAVTLRVPRAAAYRKVRNPASGYAMAGVFLARHNDGAVRLAVTGAGSGGVFRLGAAEQALTRGFAVDRLADIAMNAGDAIADLHGSAEYRAGLVMTLARRTLADCQAGG
ncbi:MAG: xanthine dehydrogenase family protein subunit M [Bauldia sp.]